MCPGHHGQGRIFPAEVRIPTCSPQEGPGQIAGGRAGPPSCHGPDQPGMGSRLCRRGWVLALSLAVGISPSVAGALFQDRQEASAQSAPICASRMTAWPQREGGQSQREFPSHLELPAGWTQVWPLSPVHTGHARFCSPDAPSGITSFPTAALVCGETAPRRGLSWAEILAGFQGASLV